jgi:hypothetical protein
MFKDCCREWRKKNYIYIKTKRTLNVYICTWIFLAIYVYLWYGAELCDGRREPFILDYKISRNVNEYYTLSRMQIDAYNTNTYKT